MQRSEFIRLLGLGTVSSFLPISCRSSLGSIPITIHSNDGVGHLVREARNSTPGRTLKTEVLIVGGGISGLSAAHQLKSRDFVLVELDDHFGGTSSAVKINEAFFTSGAHYELSPQSFHGQEVKTMLEELGILYFKDGQHYFKDRQFLIPKQVESKTFEHGKFRADVIEDLEDRERLNDFFASQLGKYNLPSHLSSKDTHELNELSFEQWLIKEFGVKDKTIADISYQMRDDYGGGAREVSAFAGIHYYACRDYYQSDQELFSPPQGNYYFIEKIMAKLPEGRIKSGHVLLSVEEGGAGFKSQVWDVKRKELLIIESSKVIYTGKKHILKYIYPKASSLYKDSVYAPWMVMNLEIKENWELPGPRWQNEILDGPNALMGFVDSGAQSPVSGNRIITTYFCFRPEERQELLTLKSEPQKWVQMVVDQLNKYYQVTLDSVVQSCHITLYGHAMAIPSPGYLRFDQQINNLGNGFVMAGVDAGRLPLIYEALDSGIWAAGVV